MLHRKLGNTGISVGKVALGTAFKEGWSQAAVSPPESLICSR
jgi:hypothetical protein